MTIKSNNLEELNKNRGILVADFGTRTFDTLKKDDGTIEVFSYSGYTRKEVIDAIVARDNVDPSKVVFSRQ